MAVKFEVWFNDRLLGSGRKKPDIIETNYEIGGESKGTIREKRENIIYRDGMKGIRITAIGPIFEKQKVDEIMSSFHVKANHIEEGFRLGNLRYGLCKYKPGLGWAIVNKLSVQNVE